MSAKKNSILKAVTFKTLMVFGLLGSLLANAYFVLPAKELRCPVTTSLPQSQDIEYVQYRPVFFNLRRRKAIESPYMIDTHNMTQEHIQNTILVFRFFGVEHKMDDEKLMVARDQWEDKDTMANFTAKANDPEWVLSRAAMLEKMLVDP